ncbi:hypothetical protein F751_6717 [Auxenochlorella protothecoides]|uniref:Uncharacterized protein n=1 Tax=Auxenochlorella protothecoides TaxID=3075 RepID=A0A087SAD2_AUXPR|nr:hypothetical protein F751_6717 [Auxenochlorella protothecoides]KFM22686.1 hypothetical protein F751_6717 [Auxenochlorella protothecoides]
MNEELCATFSVPPTVAGARCGGVHLQAPGSHEGRHLLLPEGQVLGTAMLQHQPPHLVAVDGVLLHQQVRHPAQRIFLCIMGGDGCG